VGQIHHGRVHDGRNETGQQMRNRRQHRRDSRTSSREVYQMRERLVDIGDDYWIETQGGRRAFKVDGKVMRLRDTFVIEGPDGSEQITMKHRPVRVRDVWSLARPGRPEATLHKALVGPLRDRWVVEADDIGEWKIQGNLVDHEYRIDDNDGNSVAETSKRWFRVRDTYGVEVDPEADAALVLAITVAIDQAAHD
jgi:uncharacterized protein YxjI